MHQALPSTQSHRKRNEIPPPDQEVARFLGGSGMGDTDVSNFGNCNLQRRDLGVGMGNNEATQVQYLPLARGLF